MKNTSPDNVVLSHFSCSEYKPPSSTLSARLSGEILLTLAQVTAGSWPGAGVSHYTHYTSLLSPANIATQALLSTVGNKSLIFVSTMRMRLLCVDLKWLGACLLSQCTGISVEQTVM